MVLLNMMVGIEANGIAADTICPFTTGGVVAPQPFPYSTMVSPGVAGVLTFGNSVVGPTRDRLSECVATMYLSLLIRKNDGAASCAGTLTDALVSPLLDTTT